MSDPSDPLESLFTEAVRLPEGQREACVKERCGENRALLDELRTLIRHFEQAKKASLFESPQSSEGSELSRGDSPGPPRPPDNPSPPQSPKRYQFAGLQGAGGLGDVWRATDRTLDRVVALKRLKAIHQLDSRARDRFFREARITAQLGHPSVAPVFEMGENDEGEPYYTMRLVEGKTLREAIVDFHAERDSARKNPVELRRLVSALLSVSQAIAHAHRRGVAHLDLKPGNVVLGEFGEVILLDWGLARQVVAGSETTRPEGALPVDIPSEKTPARMGTPAYMAPEQATGDGADALTDVHGLGAILYEILTGEPPHRRLEREDRHAFYQRISREPVAPCRSIRPHAPRPLAAVAEKALAIDRDARYDSAEALVADLQRWLDDQRVSAHRESVFERAGRWSRRHKAWTRATAAALVLVSVVSLFAASLIAGARSEEARQRRRAESLAQAEREARQKAERARTDESVARQESEAVANYMIGAFMSPDPELDGRSIAVAQILDREAERLHGEFQGDSKLKARLLGAIGRSYLGLGLPREAVPLLEESLQKTREALGEKNEETQVARSHLAAAYCGAGQPAKAIPLPEKDLAATRRRRGADDSETLKSINNLAMVYQDVGRLDEAIPLFERALSARQKTLGPDHPHTVTSASNLATAYRDAGRLDEAITLLEQTTERSRRALGEDSLGTLAAENNLATAYVDARRPEDAARVLETTLRHTKEKLGDAHPNTLSVANNLALAYHRAGRAEEAIRLYEQTLDAARARLGKDHPDTLESMLNLAAAYRQSGQPERAIPLLKETLERCERIGGPKHPFTVRVRDKLAEAYGQRGNFQAAHELYDAKEDPEKAAAWKRKLEQARTKKP